MIVAMLPAFLLLILAEAGGRWYRLSRIHRDQFWKASMVIHKPSEDAGLIYELVPEAETVREGVRIKINAAGFRDDEFPEEIPETSQRIVVLGDSVAWGWGVPMEQAFPQVLERLLSHRVPVDQSPPVVYNLAVDGYSTKQELRLLGTQGLPLQPDLVIISYVLNDPDTMDGGLARYYAQPRLELLHLAGKAFLRVKHLLGGNATTNHRQGNYHQYIHAHYQDQIRKHFRQLGQISKEKKLPIVVALNPVFAFEAGAPYSWQNLHDAIEQLCNENDLEFIDLYRSFQGQNSRDFSLDQWHPTAKGHAVIANTLVDYLQGSHWE